MIYKGAKLGHMLFLVHPEKTYQQHKKIESEVDIINAVEGDNQFSFKAFQEYSEEKNIRLDTSSAKDENICAHGNKLGI